MSKKDAVEQIAEVHGVEEDTLLAAAAEPNAAAVLRPVSGLYERSSPAVLPSPDADIHDLMPLPITGWPRLGCGKNCGSTWTAACRGRSPAGPSTGR